MSQLNVIVEDLESDITARAVPKKIFLDAVV